MDPHQRQGLIAQYEDGHRVLLDALAGITESELDARPADGSWTAREVVHHLADSEMTSAIRLRRVLIEDQPRIEGYDEEAFADGLYYAQRPIEAALDAVQAARATTAEILARMSEADWSRCGTHGESGPYGALDWLQIYSAHAHDHAEQIRRARAVGT